jgi:hypothetical protein
VSSNTRDTPGGEPQDYDWLKTSVGGKQASARDRRKDGSRTVPVPWQIGFSESNFVSAPQLARFIAFLLWKTGKQESLKGYLHLQKGLSDGTAKRVGVTIYLILELRFGLCA